MVYMHSTDDIRLAPHPDVIRVVREVTVIAPNEVRVAGRCQVLGEQAPGTQLAELLYAHFYIRSTNMQRYESSDGADPEFVYELSRRNSGHGTWERGWRLLSCDRVAVVRRGGLRLWCLPSDVEKECDDSPGSLCRVRIPKEYANLQDGFYIINGDGLGQTDAALDIRLYWNLTHQIAPSFVSACCTVLNSDDIPFQAKLLNNPRTYRRADAAVIYTTRRHFAECAEHWERIHHAVAAGMCRDVPMFTKRLGAGLAVAASPADGTSFGFHRCQIIASGLLAAYRSSAPQDFKTRLRSVTSAFEDAGLDVSAPYVGCRSDRDLGLDLSLIDIPTRAALTAGCGEMPSGDDVLQSKALQIGRWLCETAYWDEAHRRCNWIGRQTEADMGQAARVAAGPLGPGVYDGLAGVALFLAELGALTGDAIFRRTAVSAIRCAYAQIQTGGIDRIDGLGFFTGLSGLAFSAHRVQQLVEPTAAADVPIPDERMWEQAWDRRSTDGDDLVSGTASTIPALLVLATALRCDTFREWAVLLAEDLMASTLRVLASDWQCTNHPLLTGFSHGAAGIGVALLEAYAVTGGADLLDAARCVLDYEQNLFDPAVRNWPDFRFDDPPEHSGRFACTWCHGAPGIALSRIRAAALDPARAADYTAQAALAIDTTAAELTRQYAVRDDCVDATPCHGLSGLIEVVLVGGQSGIWPSHGCDAKNAARQLARLESGVREVTSGTPCGGTNPSMMLGAAGVGYQLLRCGEPRGVPSILTVPRP